MSREAADVNRRVIEMIKAHRQLFLTITIDSGPEFHGYKEIEETTGVTIYSANPLRFMGARDERKTPMF